MISLNKMTPEEFALWKYRLNARLIEKETIAKMLVESFKETARLNNELMANNSICVGIESTRREEIVLWFSWIKRRSTWRMFSWQIKCWVFVKLGLWESEEKYYANSNKSNPSRTDGRRSGTEEEKDAKTS